MSIPLRAGKRSLAAQAPRRRESTLVYKAEGCFCSSQVTITCAPKSSASPRSEAKQLHLPKPLQAEPHSCQPPKSTARLSALPSTSSSISTPHLKSQHFTICPFPPAPLSHAGLFWVGSSTPCPDAPPQPGPVEAKSTTPATSNKSRDLLSGCRGSSAPSERPRLPVARKLQESPGASSSSQPSLCCTSQLLSFLTTVCVICSNEMGDFKAW